MARKNYTDAVDYYQRALRRQNSPTDSARLWNKIGIASQQNNNYGAARKAYKRSMHLDRNFSDPWNNMGTTYFLANKFKSSLKYYEHAIALEPKSALYHLNLGTSFSRLKKYDLAVKEYQVALTLDPNVLTQHGYGGSVIQPEHPDVEYFYNMGKVFASLGRTDEAIRYLRRAFEEGFNNFKRLDADPDFRKISNDPSYIALRKRPPIAIKED
jgi:tetratricopeptide (TPR) repeat protein